MKYNCKCCDYSTNHKGIFERHENSVKHNDKLLYYFDDDDDDNDTNNKKTSTIQLTCEYCNKQFNYISSKFTHVNGLYCKKIPKNVMDKICQKKKLKNTQKKNTKVVPIITTTKVEPIMKTTDITGMLYLIQPAELIGTDRYKIGCSNSPTLDRVRSYRKGSLYLSIKQVKNSMVVEKQLIALFKEKFTLFVGNEYFRGNADEMIKVFDNFINTNFISC